MFNKGDRVIINPKVATLPKYKEYEEYIRPGIFDVIDSNEDYSFIEDEEEVSMSFPNEMLLKIPLYHIGDEVIVNAEDYDGHPFGVTGDMEQLNGKKFKIRARHNSAYKVENLGEDGYKYIINEPDCFKWASTDFKKAITDEEIDDLNNDLDNLLKENDNENRLQEEGDDFPIGKLKQGCYIHGRKNTSRISICPLVYTEGIRG